MNFKRHIHNTSQSFQMAPMLDIMFILLIHFMAATIFAQWENKLGIQVPAADSGIRTDRQPGEVIINIDEAGLFYINSQVITSDRLEFLLKQIASTFKSQPVIVRADSNTRHKAVIKVLDICRRADIWNVAFATIPKENQP